MNVKEEKCFKMLQKLHKCHTFIVQTYLLFVLNWWVYNLMSLLRSGTQMEKVIHWKCPEKMFFECSTWPLPLFCHCLGVSNLSLPCICPSPGPETEKSGPELKPLKPWAETNISSCVYFRRYFIRAIEMWLW